ncbi:tyrosine-protein phosphatase 69D isoform X1 [Neodiprion lecontei]|uniref:protein-tyrosine-phosphatase n=1 Tax=Neodiprion lecontei TaxID=441921 RepID=A0A6J0C344_NEOLC|nr:tyrosine-protein phosphatase 69D isoform X1 [Neodiprion lecontei]
MLRSQAPTMKISSLFVCFLLAYTSSENPVNNSNSSDLKNESQETASPINITVSQPEEYIEAGTTPSLTCKSKVQGYVWWTKDGGNLTLPINSSDGSLWQIKKASGNDTGNYTCVAQTLAGNLHNETRYIRVVERAKIMGGHPVRVKTGEPAVLSCYIEGYPLSNFTWMKISGDEISKNMPTQDFEWNGIYREMIVNFTKVSSKHNGTYECSAKGAEPDNYVKNQTSLTVTDVPQVYINTVKAVGAHRVFLNWTINDRNDPVKEYTIQYKKSDAKEWHFNREPIDGSKTSYVLTNLDNNTDYEFKIEATNTIGRSPPNYYEDSVRTLEQDPVFVPNVVYQGVTSDSIQITWDQPGKELQDHFHYYKLISICLTDNRTKEACLWNQTNKYVFSDLVPRTNYTFSVVACNTYTNECGNWSTPLQVETDDGVPSPPQNVSVICEYSNTSNSGNVYVTWAFPVEPNGVITRFSVQLNSSACYKNDSGIMGCENVEVTPVNIDVKKNMTKKFEGLLPNTNYTVSVNAETKLGKIRPGKFTIDNCSMPIAVPSKDNMNNVASWKKIDIGDQHLFQLKLRRISERNGPICCYRIFVVKLAPNQKVRDLIEPRNLDVDTYQKVYTSRSGGVYLADMFDSDSISTTIFIGDDKISDENKNCHYCVGLKPKTFQSVLNLANQPPSTDTENITSQMVDPAVSDASTGLRRRRENNPYTSINYNGETYLPEDGPLDKESNYTAFIEIIVNGSEPGQFLPAYSNYLNPHVVGSYYPVPDPPEDLGLMMQICVAVLIIVIIILMGMCVLHKYLKHARQGGEEIISLRNSFRHLCRTLRGRHQLVASNPPDMPPISRADLLQAYIDRHRDSDYGFQHEFELLPDRFADRTTRASEARENLYKNRYPDIKCYDQTRVRLVQVDGICGSDYINANFVLGYKERKKFICAQGPMENTVCDYWRMIWEQHLELVLMLTNLEEYSKTKCAKYWPDKSESRSFGDITVEHVRERPYSDYVVRELKMTRTGERDSRIIIQYHFLVWKDFMAPEHPHAILRFIKRVNEAYSLEKGPILVHCSAGVGRTGTLVALDSLLQQLADEGQVSIFNTVCDLRHQRNFLVQSLKQYIFVYRALMEMAQFGDTEIPAAQLKNHVEKLRQRDNGKDKTKMEEEYDKISSMLEDRKSFSVGGGDENRIKNRNDLVIPYDRNRVILTPVPGREHSTYINASFIEGYDNSESFIITQDPLESTIPDFWRMISEQCASTIVMLSDLSDGPRKCPRYWSDDEVAYDHIKVRYIQSESCPYYTRRELCIINEKTDENMIVTQYHYHGWPTVEGEVPEVTRGLIELVDQTISNDVESGGPLVVHCHCGSDRSSMFVALSILVQQLRTERRVDIFTTTKKLRSQRHGMIGSFAQYEFLHRAIVNYSDLHNLAEDEAAS